MATLQGDHMLLLVDANEAHTRFIASIAARGGWRLLTATDAERAIATLGTHEGLLVDAVLIDDRAIGSNLAPTIAAMREYRPQLPILFLGDAELRGPALAAIRAGATDFLNRPLTAERLSSALENAITPRLPGDLRCFSEKCIVPLPVEEFIGSSPAFRSALAISAKAARARVPLLIEGEAGTGKALLASAVHAAGMRPRSPLVEVDCGHHADTMLAPLLFGHEKGAFPGAFDRRVGSLLTAQGGTIVIDRIERLPMAAQAMLAETLATGMITPLGGGSPQQLDVRIIASANASLRQRAKEGAFRDDLLARLSIIEVALPALRDRRGDIPALARHLLARISGMPGMKSCTLSAAATDALSSYGWPGNVRQLHDVLLRAACHSTSGQLDVEHFAGLAIELARAPEAMHSSGAAPGDGIGVTLYRADGNLRALQDIEADVIRLAIGHYRGRMSEVARRLGIGRSTLYRKLADLGIDTAA